MNKFKKISILVCVFALLLTLNGCNLLDSEPSKPANEIVKEAIKNFYSMRSAKYEITFVGDANPPQELATDAPQTSIKKGHFDFKLAGLFDFNDMTVPQFTSKLDGVSKEEGGVDQNLNVELRANKDYMYGFLTELPDLGEAAPTDMIKLFMNQWWKMPIPAVAWDRINVLPKEESTLTPEEKQLRELAQKTDFIKNVKFLGNERIMGENSYHYSGDLDKDALKNFLLKVTELSGQQVEDTQLQSLEALMNGTDLSVEIWVGKSDMSLRKVAGNVRLEPATGGAMDSKFEIAFGDINDNLKIEEPKDSKEFDPSSLLGGSALDLSGSTGTDGLLPELPADNALDALTSKDTVVPSESAAPTLP